MNVSLEGKNAVICGSTQGIGLAIARVFAEQGARCFLLARNEAVLQEIIPQLSAKFDQKHQYRVADFSSPWQVKEVIYEICSEFSIHILVNNTGGPPAGPITEASEDAFLSAFNQHLISSHLLTQAVIPCMRSASYGRIINIISTSVRTPLPNLGVSNTIRGAVASWAKTLSLELGEFGITVNNVLPGYTETGRLKSLIELKASEKGISEEEVKKSMVSDIPMKRFGKAAETAAVVGFLASPAASYVNGVSIPVDGGRTGTI